ncbi:Transmembrane domain-containing protein [Orpheovirus IHUMI-LCC2]|uniref:Transmembrane domain-containing protein n=1 Tax=Orpheovirus IHUMI-LCC2 TaxID=2023057 RepID=A0A2I2L3U8_9VIRU|nr:Transmembrane domain-containing protein [Orpheovirus IHUMI-LCC2]SNW62204.1 Transmembrane domain-containing protein [Orpheovirus IHUMI-LCC2]
MEDVLVNIFSYIHPYYINKNITLVCKEYNKIYNTKIKLIQSIQTLREFGNFSLIYNQDIYTYIKIYSIWYPISECLILYKNNREIVGRNNIKRALSLGYEHEIILDMINRYYKRLVFNDIHNLLYSYNMMNVLNIELCKEGISNHFLIESIYHGNNYIVKGNVVEINVGDHIYTLTPENIINECMRPELLKGIFLPILLNNDGFKLGYIGSEMEIMQNIHSGELEYIIYGYLLRNDKKDDTIKILFEECVRINNGNMLIDKMERYVYYLQDEHILKLFYSIYTSEYILLMFGILPFNIFKFVLPIVYQIEAKKGIQSFYQQVCNKNISILKKSNFVYNISDLLQVYIISKDIDIGEKIINVIKSCKVEIS